VFSFFSRHRNFLIGVVASSDCVGLNDFLKSVFQFHQRRSKHVRLLSLVITPHAGCVPRENVAAVLDGGAVN
jgi:hypothetical protein